MNPFVRTVLLRLFGILVAAVFGAAATALLARGLSFEWPWFTRNMQALASDLVRPLDQGWAVLAGILVIVLALLAGLAMVKRAGRRSLRIQRNEAGTATLDVRGVARVLQRRLRASMDAQIGVAARRRRLVVVTPFHAGAGALDVAHQAAESVPDILNDLGADQIRYSIVTGKAARRRTQ